MVRKKSSTGPVSLGSLFLKYKKTLKAPQGSVIKQLINVIEKEVGIKLEEKHFSYNVNKRTISCRASGIIRMEIKMKQKEIERELRKKLGDQNTPQVFL